jgi:hypothetical protein
MDDAIISNVSQSLKNGKAQEYFRYERHPSPAASHVLFQVFEGQKI